MSNLRNTDQGLAIIVNPESDKPFKEIGTVMCVHCGGHFERKPGSGKIRGWCMNCSGFVCGPGCGECVPVEQMLENVEKGRPPNWKPTQIFVPRVE